MRAIVGFCSLVVVAACAQPSEDASSSRPVGDAAADQDSADPLREDAVACGAGIVEACERLVRAIRTSEKADASSLYATVCEARGLEYGRQEACVDFKTRIARQANCSDETHWLFDVPICPNSMTIEIPLRGRIQSQAFAEAALQKSLARLFVEHERPYRECYSGGLFRHPRLSGTIELAFVVDRIGALTNIKARSRTIYDAAMIDCVVRTSAAYRADFHPAEAVDASAELTFRP